MQKKRDGGKLKKAGSSMMRNGAKGMRSREKKKKIENYPGIA